MTDKAKLYFDYFIRHGYNHIEFPEESIQMREGLIILELLDIENKLPHPLKGQKPLTWLSRELAEISIVVQGFAIHYFDLSPAKEMLVLNVGKIRRNAEVRHKRITQTGIDPETDNSVVFLRGLIKKLWVKGIKQESISLIIGDDSVPVPRELRFQTVASFLLRLERLTIARTVAAREQKKSIRKQLFIAVEQSVGKYIQSLNNEPTNNRISIIAPLIAAIVLMAAGFQQTVDDYKPNNKIANKGKYYSYQEIRAMQLAHARMRCTTNVLLSDLPFN